MIKLSRKHPRYGYRRVAALLRREGWAVNLKRIHRLWRANGLKVPQIQRKRRRLGTRADGCSRRAALSTISMSGAMTSPVEESRRQRDCREY
jgi:transposase InsO family protein